MSKRLIDGEDVIYWAQKRIEEARQAEYYGKMLYDIYEGLIREVEEGRFDITEDKADE